MSRNQVLQVYQKLLNGRDCIYGGNEQYNKRWTQDTTQFKVLHTSCLFEQGTLVTLRSISPSWPMYVAMELLFWDNSVTIAGSDWIPSVELANHIIVPAGILVLRLSRPVHSRSCIRRKQIEGDNMLEICLLGKVLTHEVLRRRSRASSCPTKNHLMQETNACIKWPTKLDNLSSTKDINSAAICSPTVQFYKEHILRGPKHALSQQYASINWDFVVGFSHCMNGYMSGYIGWQLRYQ